MELKATTMPRLLNTSSLRSNPNFLRKIEVRKFQCKNYLCGKLKCQNGLFTSVRLLGKFYGPFCFCLKPFCFKNFFIQGFAQN